MRSGHAVNNGEDPITLRTIGKVSFWFQNFDLTPVANGIGVLVRDPFFKKKRPSLTYLDYPQADLIREYKEPQTHNYVEHLVSKWFSTTMFMPSKILSNMSMASHLSMAFHLSMASYLSMASHRL